MLKHKHTSICKNTTVFYDCFVIWTPFTVWCLKHHSMQLLKDNTISETVKNQNLTPWWKWHSKLSLESLSYTDVSLCSKITSPALLSRIETAMNTVHLSSAPRHYWEKRNTFGYEGIHEKYILLLVHPLLSLLEQKWCKYHQIKHSPNPNMG